MRHRVTMKIIAAELHLNESTVSRALSGKGGVGQATRRRVMAVAQQLGYHPRSSAVPRPFQIVLLVEERTMREKDFWSYVMNGLVSEVPVHHGFLSIAVTDARSPACTLPPLLQQVGQVDGVIAMHATDLRAIQALKRLGIPIVGRACFLGRSPDGPSRSFIALRGALARSCAMKFGGRRGLAW